MKTQLILALQNLEQVLEQVITGAGYECQRIVRLNVYSTSSAELWTHFHFFQDWIAKHDVKQALNLLDVKGLFETLKIEFEATVVK